MSVQSPRWRRPTDRLLPATVVDHGGGRLVLWPGVGFRQGASVALHGTVANAVDQARVQNSLLEGREQLALETILPDGESVAANTTVAVARTAISHIPPFSLAADDDDTGAA